MRFHRIDGEPNKTPAHVPLKAALRASPSVRCAVTLGHKDENDMGGNIVDIGDHPDPRIDCIARDLWQSMA